MDNRYFKRDISWLSFNYRVLLEAEDETLPLYERINFISIYSSNLEEFYNHIHRSILEKESHRNPYSVAVIYSYLYNKEHEVNRLTIAIECVRYGVQHDEAMRYICNSLFLYDA